MAKGATRDGFCGCEPHNWCNDCCPQLHRFFLLIVSVVIFGIALWQAAHVGSWRQDMLDKGTFENDPMKSNEVSAQVLNHAEFASCVSIGAAVAFAWHCLKWNVATRQVLTVLLLGSFSVQLVTLGFASQQNEKDKPSRGTGDIATPIVSAGSAGVILAGLSLFGVLVVQCFSANYLSANKQTNCCDNLCCNVSNDCCVTDQCCGVEMFCSFGRWLLFATTLVFAAVFFVRAAVAADVFNDMLDMNKRGSNINIVGNIISFPMVSIVITVSAVLAGYVVATILHSAWIWNETTQTIVLAGGFVAITFEVLAVGYSIKFWDIGVPKNSPDLDERFDTIASLSVISFACACVTWVLTWFFSDNFASYDIDQEEKKQSSNCVTCCNVFGRTIAMIILLVLLVLAFGLYIARAADGGDVFMDVYDKKNVSGNYVSLIMLTFMFFNAGLGMGMSLFGLAHLYFWNRVTASTMGAGFLILLGLDMLTLAVSAKHTEVDVPAGQPKLEKDLVAIAALSMIQPAVSLVIIFIAFACSCDFNQAEYGTPRSGDDSDATDTTDTDEETGTSGTSNASSY